MNAFENFVKIQSDAALRQVAGQYAYDDNEADTEELTLRSGGEEINEQLEQKLNERLAMAGMEVVEARINYLAYAPEIAAGCCAASKHLPSSRHARRLWKAQCPW